MSKSILLIDDDPRVLALFSAFFERKGWSVSQALDGAAGVSLFERDAPDIVITDLDMPGMNGVEVTERLRAFDPDAVVLVLTGHGDTPIAVQALQLGAESFLTKPVSLAHLEIAAERALEKARLRMRTVLARGATPPTLEVAAFDSTGAMRRLGEQLELLAAGTAPVLLGGETGTGKGWLARRLHSMSPRAAAPFVEINCAGLSATFLDSELFGHERGAFTGANTLRRGLFEIADGGTLFLDEIGDLAPDLQPKLLTVLERQRFRRLGGVREIAVDVRLIAASNIDLRGAVRAKRFREDLYYRLAVAEMRLPPLRERGSGEITRLALALLADLRLRVGRGPDRIADDALVALLRYPFHGNIRELRNILERALLLAANASEIGLAHLPFEIATSARGTQLSCGDADDLSLACAERLHIARVMALSGQNKAHAARSLGISRATLYSKLRENDEPMAS